MSAETIIYNALRGLAGDRVFPDVAPEGTARPYLTYQQIGGAAVNFEDGAIPNKANGIFQINVWADTRSQASDIAKLVEAAFRTTPALQATVLSAPLAMYEDDTKLYGSMQDFSTWTNA